MFKKEFWQSSALKLRSIQYLTIMAILIALKITLSSFFVPVGENLRIYVTFFIGALEGAIFGPVGALVCGACSDILGCIVHPSGPFFFGYTLSAMCGSFIYALFLYRTQITVVKLAAAKLIINLLVNVCMGSLWSYMMFSNAYIYYFVKSLIKNITLLPMEVIALVLIFNLLLPYLQKKNLVITQNSPRIPLFKTTNTNR